MSPTPMIVEMKHNKELAAAADMAAQGLGPTPPADFAEATVDPSFPPVQLPRLDPRETATRDPYDLSPQIDINPTAEDSTYVVRVHMDGDPEAACEKLNKRRNVVNVFADPVIKPTQVCPDSPPVGTDKDVEDLLGVKKLWAIGATGEGVLVAIVDSGINLEYLRSRGKDPGFDQARSWVPDTTLTPGELPVGHGTMCAYDACIAAPKCTLLDIAVLQSSTGTMGGLLSDAVRAYGHLLNLMMQEHRPGDLRSMVVSNSWGMFHPSWDLPVGHDGNYSDNPNHPFNRIVATLERAGADILFAAGNCGPECPDSRCRGATVNAIYGANGHPAVTCVAGVDVEKTRVGYSSVGPGRLEERKPDISGYTHFRGSGVYHADGGTSAATPVVAGVLAAARSQFPLRSNEPATSPVAMRSLLTTTALDLGPSGYDFLHGYGIADAEGIATRLGLDEPDPCEAHPWLCIDLTEPFDICEAAPWLCEGRWPPSSGPPCRCLEVGDTVPPMPNSSGAIRQLPPKAYAALRHYLAGADARRRWVAMRETRERGETKA